MLGMGGALRVQDFAQVARAPRPLVLGVILQLVLVPVVAVIVSRITNMPDSWAVGIYLVAVCPGGAFSNLLTFIARGHVALSISLTAVATIGCIVTVPLVLEIIASAQLPQDFVFPRWRILREMGLLVITPLFVGMMILRFAERAAPWISRAAIRAGLALLGLSVLGAIGSGRIDVLGYGLIPPLRILFFGAVVAVLIPQLCRLFRTYDDETTAISIEVCIRNVGVGLLLMQYFFPGQEAQGHVLYTCLFYSGMSLWTALPLVGAHRFGRSPVFFRRRRARPNPAPEAS